MSSEFWSDVINDYENLFETEEGYDTIIYVGENKEEIHAHSIIMRSRCQYFRAALSDKWVEKKDGKFIFTKPNIEPTVFRVILRFIYCGNVDLTGLQKLELLQLFMALDEINIQPLMTHVQKYLTEHMAMFSKFDSIEMLKIIHQHEFFTELWDEHLEIICEEPRALFSSKDFTSLSEMLLMDILKCNTLKVDEITIWESVLKWGLDKHPSFVKDAKKWDKTQFKMLRTTLNKIIPLVNFRDFDSTTFFYQVLPYQKLLPKDKLYDILEKHLVRINNRPTLTRYRQASNSNILNLHHLAIFSTWMDKRNSYYKIHKNPHKFKSLYHQLLCEDFYFKSNIMDLGMLHSSCINAKATLIVAKIKDSDQLVGGFIPIRLRKPVPTKVSNYISTKDSFIFYFTNCNDVKTGKFAYVTEKKDAIHYNDRCEIGFGSGHDLNCKSDGNWTSVPTSYLSIGIPAVFKISQYEIFEVVRFFNGK